MATLWRDYGTLFAVRVVVGPLAALGLGYLIHRTLLVPQTMAATGLFYIAILFVIAARPPSGRELELANEIHGSSVDALQLEARALPSAARPNCVETVR